MVAVQNSQSGQWGLAWVLSWVTLLPASLQLAFARCDAMSLCSLPVSCFDFDDDVVSCLFCFRTRGGGGGPRGRAHLTCAEILPEYFLNLLMRENEKIIGHAAATVAIPSPELSAHPIKCSQPSSGPATSHCSQPPPHIQQQCT